MLGALGARSNWVLVTNNNTNSLLGENKRKKGHGPRMRQSPPTLLRRCHICYDSVAESKYWPGHAIKLRPAEKFVARWKVGPAHPPGKSLGSRSGCWGHQTGSLAARWPTGYVWASGAGLKSFPLLTIGVQAWVDSAVPHPAGFTWDDDLGTVVPSRLPTTLWALTRGTYTRKGPALRADARVGSLRSRGLAIAWLAPEIHCLST